MTPADKAKAKKLFAMLSSSNENERRVANTKLIELLAKYKMTITDLVAGDVDWDAPSPKKSKAKAQSSAPPPPPPPQPPPIKIPQQHIDLLAEFLAAEYQETWGTDLRQDRIAMERLKQAAETAIINLLSATTTHIYVPHPAQGVLDGDLSRWLSHAEFQQLLTNPPPPPSPGGPRGAASPSSPPRQRPGYTWQPKTMTKADKIALGGVLFFLVGLPLITGMVDVFHDMPQVGLGLVLFVGGICWATWQFNRQRAPEGFAGIIVGLIGLGMLADFHEKQLTQQSDAPPKIAYSTEDDSPPKPPVPAADISVSVVGGVQVISITGDIGPDDHERFKQKVEGLTAKAVVQLSSPGGLARIGWAIGAYVHSKGWATFVSGECDSACADIWLAGTPRFMTPTAKIGFHSSRDQAGRQNAPTDAVSGAYMRDLGLNIKAITWATTAGPYDIAYLTPDKAKELGIDVIVRPDIRSLGLEDSKPIQSVAATKVTPPIEQSVQPVPAPAEIINMLMTQLKSCWAPPSNIVDARGPIVTVRFSLNRDGSLQGEPTVVNRSGSALFQVAAESATRAVRVCQPFRLPASGYEVWREIEVNFDPAIVATHSPVATPTPLPLQPPIVPAYRPPAAGDPAIIEASECRYTGFRKQCCPGGYAFSFVDETCHWLSPSDPRGQADSVALCEQAEKIITNLITNQYMDPLVRMTRYADTVKYYGIVKDSDAVKADIRFYSERWPQRTYKITSISSYGNNTMCGVYGEVAFDAESPTKKSVGTATFEFGLENQGYGELRITAESGKTLTRQITDLVQAQKPVRKRPAPATPQSNP
jgi:Hsp70 protein